MSGRVPGVRIVLHQVQGMDNLGSVARLMANFGFSDLCLSDPIHRSFQEAERMAVHSTHVLAAMTVRDTLADALGDAVYVVGSTSREEAVGRNRLEPEA